MTSDSSIAKPDFEPGSIVAGWTVLSKLGSGGFGAVYHVKKADIEAALKTEFISGKESQPLCNEVHCLRLVQWSRYFCRLFNACKVATTDGKEMNVMAMSLCGRPLSRLRRMTPKRHFTKSTAAWLSRRILLAIKDLHSVGILHRDVKASNCAWVAESREVYMFDFGFCRRYLERDEEGRIKHRNARYHAGFLGTTKYCSINAHEERDQGRRDDLWAWLYMTAEFFIGSLPWSQEDNSLLIGRKKIQVGAGLIRKCPRELMPIYDHIKILKFNSKPDYELILRKFDQMFLRLDIDESDPLDFEEGGFYYDEYFLDKQSSTEKEELSDESSMEEESSVDTAVEMVPPRNRMATGVEKAIRLFSLVANPFGK